MTQKLGQLFALDRRPTHRMQPCAAKRQCPQVRPKAQASLRRKGVYSLLLLTRTRASLTRLRPFRGAARLGLDWGAASLMDALPPDGKGRPVFLVRYNGAKPLAKQHGMRSVSRRGEPAISTCYSHNPWLWFCSARSQEIEVGTP
jgi:hypothetical protein